MASTRLPRGLDGRSRDQTGRKTGEIRQKRADTLVRTLRAEYGKNFAKGYRNSTTLGAVREKEGKSLHQLIRATRK